MKKTFLLTLAVLVVTVTANIGCNKLDTTAAIPDIVNFELKAATAFVKGAASTISILAPGLADGAYNISYTLGAANSESGLTATLNISGGAGTFLTQALSNAGETDITINSISNASGSSANLSANNTYKISDSTGLMTGTYTSGGSSTALRATHVIAILSGSTLNISCVIWEPNLINVTLFDYIYAGSTGAVSFNENDLSTSGPTSTFNGSASYGFSGTTGVISDLSAHGTITITATAPLLTGTFVYTNEDSSIVSGSFSCPHP